MMAFLVYSENFVFGSSKGNWVYAYFDDVAPVSLKRLAAIFFLIGISIFIGNKFIYIYEKSTLFTSFIITVLAQIFTRGIYPISMGTIILSDRANGFYSVAMNYSPVHLITQYQTLISTFPMHVRANLPGKILLFELLQLFTSSPEIMGYLIIAFSALGSFLLYGICDKLFQDKRAAFYAFILYALFPSKLFFFPILNTVTPVFMLACLYIFITYFENRNFLFLWLLGGAFYVLIIFDPSPLSTGFVFIGILLYFTGKGDSRKKDYLTLVIIPLLSFLFLHALFSILFSFDLIKALRFIMNDAANFNVEYHRGYWVWVGENIKEFIYGSGTPAILIFLYWVLKIFVEWKTLKSKVIGWPLEIIFILSLLITFSVLAFLGINRGETTRLWIYLAALFQVPVSLFISRIPKSSVIFLVVASAYLLQTIIAIQRVGFVGP